MSNPALLRPVPRDAGAVLYAQPDWEWTSQQSQEVLGWQGWILWLGLAGEADITTSGGKHRLAQGDAVLLPLDPGGIRMSGRGQVRQRLVWIHGEGGLAEPGQALPAYRHVGDAALLAGMMARVAEILPRDAGAAADWLVTVLHELRLHDEHAGLAQDRQLGLGRLLEAVRDEPGKDWNVTSLAALAGVGPSQLNRLCQRRYGCSPWELVIRERVERAKALLRFSDLPLTGIAAALGYADLFTFSKQFSARVGLSPSRFRGRS